MQRNRSQGAQANQDTQVDKARRQAAKDLTQSWMDRLQLISVITTFFASTEAGMLQVTTLNGGDTHTSGSSQLVNSAFLAALVLHIWAAILSFMGAFFLVRYNIKEAKEEQRQVSPAAASPVSDDHDYDHDHVQPNPLTRPQPVWTNPHLEQIGPFQRKPPTHLLSRVHNLCILLTFAGFGLALLGILAFAWAENPISVGIVTSISTAACIGGAVWVFYL
ncbi:hypothetical protein B0H15DRAFT_552293 [Mycena belliarum]|uniref:Transmembrane protein n=1 Tax=Mycena belliarum TaxID=1033014 RepID=A0AAD6UGI1_9AGAR|nr:hypothetical protein B0H15DRAFT_552293 [Mycena belliae]